jgi:hypothetical protein
MRCITVIVAHEKSKYWLSTCKLNDFAAWSKNGHAVKLGGTASFPSTDFLNHFSLTLETLKVHFLLLFFF